MRIRSVTAHNVGGVVDQTIELPDAPVVALAGPNGTGKSKMLACIVSAWSNHVPTPPSKVDAYAEISVLLSDAECQAIVDFGAALGWAEMPWNAIPRPVALRTTVNELTGVQRSSATAITALSEFASHEPMLRDNRSLDIMYLPAERRLMPSGQSGIDLSQLADITSFQKTAQSRSSIQNYGRLDDSEFEDFAKALCMDDHLSDPPEGALDQQLSRVSWDDFVETVNDLISPKALLPLYKGMSDKLLIRLPSGETHGVPDLSSGERQALVIISRVLRAGGGRSVVVIDEPDAYLHPSLSQRLMRALERGVGDDGQLIIATHSPAILDQLPPNCIIRLDHAKPAEPVADQNGIIALHRDTGFRASAVTQSDLLVVTEGQLDEVVLRELFPCLASATIGQGNGRAGVLTRVKNLCEYKVPVLGLVDRDVAPPKVSPDIADSVCILPTADIEGAFLSDDAALQVMLDLNLVKSEHATLPQLRAIRDELFLEMRESTIAEIAKNSLREKFNLHWPNSRATDPLTALRDACTSMALPPAGEVNGAIGDATAEWDHHVSAPWVIVRGKYILPAFAAKVSKIKVGDDLLTTIAHQRPELAALAQFETRLTALLPIDPRS